MTPYATVRQYEDRYGNVSDTRMLQECLEDCTAALNAELDRRHVDYADPSETFADRLMRACRNMAHRIMPTEGDADIPVGAMQASFTAGPYNQQFTLRTAYGSPKVTDDEISLLGIPRGRIGCGLIVGDVGD